MPVEPGISVRGLDELRKALAKADKDLAKDLGAAGKRAADVVVPAAQARTPVRSGRARDSLRAVTVRGGGAIRGGGAKAPYFPWLDYGGRVGRKRSVVRDYIKGGRIVYPAIDEKRDAAVDVYFDAMNDLLRRAGLR